jgi:hypothetical protein
MPWSDPDPSEQFTAGALRALDRAATRAQHRAASLIEPEDLLPALADELDSRASELLGRFGLEPPRLHDVLDAPPDIEGMSEATATRASAICSASSSAASRR